jgi:hypothetical protein
MQHSKKRFSPESADVTSVTNSLFKALRAPLRGRSNAIAAANGRAVRRCTPKRSV